MKYHINVTIDIIKILSYKFSMKYFKPKTKNTMGTNATN